MTTTPITAPPDHGSVIPPSASPAPGRAPADLTGTEIAAQAEELRMHAWQTRRDWTFQGRPLEPWAMERESLFIRLCEADVPAERLESIQFYEDTLAAYRLKARSEADLAELQGITLETLVKPMAIVPTAAKVLFLATHKPEQLDSYRGRNAGRFLRAIEEWAAANIPEEDPWPAILLARDIRAQHQHVIAQRRPCHAGRQLVGN